MSFSCLTRQQFDALREIGNVGMGQAASALSQLTGNAIHLEVPRVVLADTVAMPQLLGDAERVVVGIYLRMLGSAQGNILMVFPRGNAVRILEELLPGRVSEGDALSELELSALKELGNILASAYLNALGEMLGMTLIPSVPLISIDRVGSVIQNACAEFGEPGELTLILDTEFFSKDERISGQFFLLPSPSSLGTILSALGIVQT